MCKEGWRFRRAARVLRGQRSARHRLCKFSFAQSAPRQRAIGTGVIGGVITATVLALLLVPVFFVAVRRIFKAEPVRGDGAAGAGPAVPAASPSPSAPADGARNGDI